MSAKQAAKALLKNDAELSAFASQFRNGWESGKTLAVDSYIRENIMNTWTLTMVAEAAGATEQQVIAALMFIDPLRSGSNCVCRGRAANLFSP
jgi:hypothetical protein